MQLLGKDFFETELAASQSALTENMTSYLPDEMAILNENAENRGKNVLTRAFFSAVSFMKRYRKQAVVAASVLLIGLAVYLNWYLYGAPEVSNTEQKEVLQTDLEDTAGTAEGKDDFFATSVISRERARDEAIEVLQSVVDSAASASSEREEAAAGIAKIAANIEQENAIESLLHGKGFADCVAILQENGATVIVGAEGLLENEITQIQEVVYESAGILPVDLKIVEH